MTQKGVLHGQVGSAPLFIKERLETEEYPFLPDLRPLFCKDDELQVLTFVDHRGLRWTGCLFPAPRDQCEETGKGTAAQSSQVPQERAVACIWCGLSPHFSFMNGIINFFYGAIILGSRSPAPSPSPSSQPSVTYAVFHRSNSVRIGIDNYLSGSLTGKLEVRSSGGGKGHVRNWATGGTMYVYER